MLRLSIRHGSWRSIAGVPVYRGSGQWLALRGREAATSYKRYFADEKKVDKTLLPGTESQAAPPRTPSPPELPATNASEEIPKLDNIPKTPPPPPAEAPIASSAPVSGPTPTPLPPTGTGTASVAQSIAPKRKNRLRRFLLTLISLTLLSYGGGVWYSLHSDNFHDFFTEYVPFGEDAVGYLEEREFRRRFPGGSSDTRLHPQIRGESKVTIPSRGGVTARVAEEPSRRSSDLGSVGSHMSATGASSAAQAQGPPSQSTPADKSKAVDQAKKQAPPSKDPPASSKSSSSKTGTKDATTSKSPSTEPKAAAASLVKETAKSSSASQIDKLGVPGAEEPVVQDVVKILNDIITVVNADNAGGKYSSTIAKAKDDLGKVINNIEILKSSQAKAAADQIQANHVDFDNAAKELIRRWENELKDQETRWKDEYETEREKLRKAYDNKLKSELESTQEFFDQRLKNELLEQAIELRKEFSDSVRTRVETERKGRLAKLDELSDGVKDLEKLTGEWNTVVDSNMKTQRLLVAVESVRSTLEKTEIPKPFTTELAALKEVASDDPVVNAAIASINPTAYQRGIPSISMLIDRFRRVSAEIRKTALLPENAGVASHIASLALSKLIFKKSGLPVGQDVESVLTRAEIWLEEGDLDAAAREVNGLEGWAKVISKDWLGECRKVLEVQQALEVIATEARLQSLLVK